MHFLLNKLEDWFIKNPYTWISRLWQGIVRIGFLIYYPQKYRIYVSGHENIPSENSYLIVSNHYSYDDPPLICYATYRHPVAFVAKKELFDMHGQAFSLLIRSLGSIPIDRDKPKPSTIKQFIKAYKHNWVGAIFIEGTRNESRTHLTRTNPGAATLARIGGGLDILPVGFSGGEKKGDNLYIKIGKLIPYDKSLSPEELTKKAGQSIAKLAGLIYDAKED